MLVVLGALAPRGARRPATRRRPASAARVEGRPTRDVRAARGELVDTYEQKADRKNFLEMPVSAQYARVFELPAGADPRREIDRALAAAVAAGWQLNEGSKGVSESLGSLVVGLDKPLPTGETMSASVIVYTRESRHLPSNVTPPALLISLKSPEID